MRLSRHYGETYALPYEKTRLIHDLMKRRDICIVLRKDETLHIMFWHCKENPILVPSSMSRNPVCSSRFFFVLLQKISYTKSNLFCSSKTWLRVQMRRYFWVVLGTSWRRVSAFSGLEGLEGCTRYNVANFDEN